MVLYHYTDQSGYDGISSTNTLMPSTDTMTDSTYGKGHYFTDLEPNECERQIASYCWQNKFMTFKVQYYLKLDIPDYVKKYCRPHVYLVPVGILGKFNLLSKGLKQSCDGVKPCESCRFDPLI
ncbi:MAG: HYD1 signature containing ADP-ribosyltransferase family protein [Candidatus Omnitrophica bacterium]|nr:HYD1 signature containing ADP-ribosyltransferase family protein [Candidatus Omnitrophota bacterium]